MAANTDYNSNLQPHDLSRFKFLGAGMIGKVFRAETKSGDVVAVKKILIEQMASSDLENCKQREIDEEGKLLRSIRHDNIVTCIAVINYPEEAELWIVMEFVENGTLKKFLCPAAIAMPLNEDQIYHISLQCWSALAYLHGKYITHRDVKPENILVRDLIDGSYLIKFCDFQFSVIKARTSFIKTTAVLGFTFTYAPPEIADNVYHPTKGDVYSLGVTLCELHTFQSFWGNIGDTQLQLNLTVINDSVKRHGYSFKNPTAELQERYLPCGYRTILDSSCSDIVKTLLLKATSFNQAERPTAHQALEIMTSISSRSPSVLTEQSTFDLDSTLPAVNSSPNPSTSQAISETDRSIPPQNIHFILKGMYASNFEWHPKVNLFATATNRYLVGSPDSHMAGNTFLHHFSQQSFSDTDFIRPLLISLNHTVTGGNWAGVYYTKFIAWNPQGTLLATGCSDGYVRLWTPSGSLINTFGAAPGGNQVSMEIMQWSPDGTHIVCKGHKTKLSLWNAATGEKEQLFDNMAVCKSCDWQNNKIFACSFGNIVDIYSVNQFSPVRRLEHKTEVQQVKWDQSGKVLASLSVQELKIWGATGDIDTCMNLDEKREILNNCMAWNHDNAAPVLASGSARGDVQLWNMEGTCTNTFCKPDDQVNDLAFSPTNTLLATAYSSSCSVYIMDTRTGDQVLKYFCNNPQYRVKDSIAVNQMLKVGWNFEGNALCALTTSGDLILLDLRFMNQGAGAH